MKKLLSLILACIMLFGLLAGCNNEKPVETKPGETQGNNKPNETKPVETEPAKDPVTIKWIIGAPEQPMLDSVVEKINEYIEPLIGVTLEIELIDRGAIDEKMKMRYASGEEFDLVWTGWAGANNAIYAAEMGALMPLDDYISEVPALMEAIGADRERSGRFLTDGKLYAIANMQSIVQPYCLVVQKEYADKYGLDVSDYPSKADLDAFFEKVYANEKDVYCYNPDTLPHGSDITVTTCQNMVAAIADSFTGAPTVYHTYEHDYHLTGYRTGREWIDKGYIRKDILSADPSLIDIEENEGKYVVFTRPYTAYGMEEQFDFECYFFVDEIYWATASAIQATMTGISANCEHPVEALKVLELAMTDKYFYNLLTHGIEGINYNVVDGAVVKVEGAEYELAGWTNGNVFLDITMTEEDTAAVAALEAGATYNPYDGFVFDRTPYESEIALIKAVLTENDKAYYAVDDVEAWIADVNSKLKAAGIDKLKEAFQKAVDEFRAANPERFQ